jgi:hypothetical protein
VILADFRELFPEFRTASDTLVQGTLDQMAARLSQTVLGGMYDEAHGVWTAHALAKSPAGQSARMVNKDGTTQYSTRMLEIKLAAVAAVAVT